jgi:MFS family permease
MTEGSVKAWVADLVPLEQRGTAFGIFQMSTGLMLLPASVLAGVVWQQFGLSTALVVDAAIAFSALVLLFLQRGFEKDNPGHN